MHIYNGYAITEAARKTEEYKAAYEEEREIVKEIFGYDIGPLEEEREIVKEIFGYDIGPLEEGWELFVDD